KYQPDVVVLAYVLNDNRYASQELRDLCDVEFQGGADAPLSNAFTRGAAALFQSSRLLQFLGSQCHHIARRLAFLQPYPHLMTYTLEKNLRERDPSDSKYAQLEQQIRTRGAEMGTSVDALQFYLHALGFGHTEGVYYSHWNASYRALTRLEA